MSIYSNNRTGVAATATLVANESYKSNDIGRILYESAVNDMAFFEAVIASDFNEIKGLREGTLLEAEVAALNEASAKEFFKGMAERVKKFWAKIKGAIKAAINKLAAYVLKDGKAFVAEFEAAEKKYGKFTGKIEGVKLYNGGIRCIYLVHIREQRTTDIPPNKGAHAGGIQESCHDGSGGCFSVRAGDGIDWCLA